MRGIPKRNLGQHIGIGCSTAIENYQDITLKAHKLYVDFLVLKFACLMTSAPDIPIEISRHSPIIMTKKLGQIETYPINFRGPLSPSRFP